MYPTHDTEWALSKRGNLWRRYRGVLLTVGQKKTNGRYWARRGEDFLKGDFNSQSEAKYAAETGIDGDAHRSNDDDSSWEFQ